MAATNLAPAKFIESVLQTHPFEPPHRRALLQAISPLETPFGTLMSDEWKGSVGVFEGYNLEEHTLMVLHQLDKYFNPSAHMRLVMALHDAGKPACVRTTGGKDQQHDYTLRLLEHLGPHLPFEEGHYRLAVGLICGKPHAESHFDGDPLAPLVKAAARGKPDEELKGMLDQSLEDIHQAAAYAKKPVADFFSHLMTFFQADASSYSEEAGGKHSEPIAVSFGVSRGEPFRFNSQRGRLSFAPRPEEWIQRLEEQILQRSKT